MGYTIWLQVNRDGRAEGDDVDNSIMLELETELDRLAERLGVAKLSQFRDSWFDPKAAHESVSRLLEELRARPESLGFKPDSSTSHWPGYLIDELSYCAQRLRAAGEEGLKIRFLLVA